MPEIALVTFLGDKADFTTIYPLISFTGLTLLQHLVAALPQVAAVVVEVEAVDVRQPTVVQTTTATISTT